MVEHKTIAAAAGCTACLPTSRCGCAEAGDRCDGLFSATEDSVNPQRAAVLPAGARHIVAQARRSKQLFAASTNMGC
ncbi:hypothetical protein M8494_09005 [Serratia ureilytica]